MRQCAVGRGPRDRRDFGKCSGLQRRPPLCRGQLKSAKSLDPVFKLAFDVIPLVNTIYSLLPFYCVCFAFYRVSIPFT